MPEPVTFGPDDLQRMARLLGVHIPPERLEGIAQQLEALYQGMARINAADLRDVEPAVTFQLPWKPRS